MLELSRRKLLANASTLVLGAAVLASPARSSADATTGRDLNLDDPANNLETYIKLRGDLSGEPVYDLARGYVFALRPGQAAQPLFTLMGAQRSVYERVSALEYHAQTRYVGVLRDLQTEEPLQKWLNPLNKKHCDVPVTRYGPANTRFLTDRMVPVGAGPAVPPQGTRPWFVIDGVVHLLDQIVSPVSPQLQPDADSIIFSADAAQLADSRTSRSPSQLGFSAVEAWRDWMQMDEPGSLWWHVAGVKLSGPDEYPNDFRGELERLDDEFFAGGSA